MPGPLRNRKWERFCQEIVAGKTTLESYRLAGYVPRQSNADNMQAYHHEVRDRIDELYERRARIEEEGTKRAIELLGINKARVMQELARIGFADIRKAIQWFGETITETDNPDGGDVLVVRNINANAVRLRNSADLEDDIAAAISEVSQNATGGVRIKFHDKQAALISMGKQMGMFRERMELTGADGGPMETKDAGAGERIAGRIAVLIARAAEDEGPEPIDGTREEDS